MSKHKQQKALQKERQRQKEQEAYEKWLEQFACIGIHSIDELYDLLFDNEDCTDLPEETVENGYQGDDAWRAYGNSHDCFQETLHISKYNGKYIVWVNGALVDDYSFDPLPEDFAALFDTLEEARDYRDGLPKGDPPIEEQIRECEAALDDNLYKIKAESSGFSYNFRISYTGDLIMENLPRLTDPDSIQEALKRSKDFQSRLKEKGVTLHQIRKRPREWNRNERFYDFDVSYKGKDTTLSGQILSSMQHQCREPIDLFPHEELKAFMQEIDKDKEYLAVYERKREEDRRRMEEYREACETAYQDIPHGDGITPIPLTKNQKRSLTNYLNDLDVIFGNNACDGTLRHTVQWTIDHIEPENRAGVLEFIRNRGGYCDCEVVMNYLDR